MEVELVDQPYGTKTYVGACGRNDKLVYPGIDSCVTVTAVFDDGSRTGVHLVLVGADGSADDYKNRLGEWKTLTDRKGKPKKVVLAGAVDFWDKSLEKGLKAKYGDIVSEEKLKGNITVDKDGVVKTK